MLNGYDRSFCVNRTACRPAFSSWNRFSLPTAFGTQSGTCSVRNGYIFCTYTGTGYAVEIPYEIVDGDIDLDSIAGFDVPG